MVARDAKQKSAQRSAGGIESLGVANQSHENLLGHVFRHRWIPGHVQSEAVDRGMLLPVDFGKGIFVSARHPPQQKDVRKIGRLSHLSYYGRPALLLVTYSRTEPKRFPISTVDAEHTH